MRTIKFSRIKTFLLTALIISLLANLILFQRAEQYYLQLNGVQLDPLGLSLYAVNDSRPNLEVDQKLVVFVGDSRALHWPFPQGLADFHFMNRGGGGQTSEQVAGRFDVHVRSLEPELVIIQVCINDLKTIPLFPRQKEKIVQTCEENIEEMVSKSLEWGAMVILTTIVPQGRIPIERRLFWSPGVAEGEQEVNTLIDSLAGERVIVFNTTQVLVDDSGIVRREYSEDFLHLNDAGYQALNVELVKILMSLPDN